MSADFDWVNGGRIFSSLGVNAASKFGYFNAIEIQFRITGNTHGYNFSIQRTKQAVEIRDGVRIFPPSADGSHPGNVQLIPVNGIIYSADAPRQLFAVNKTSALSIIMVGNFVETATMTDSNGKIVSQFSINWHSTMEITRSSINSEFNCINGSIGLGHVKLP